MPVMECEEIFGIPEQADPATDDGLPYGADRCPASDVPALHVPFWIDEMQGYCVRCRAGFFA